MGETPAKNDGGPHERPLAGIAANAGAFCILTIGDGLTKLVTQTMPLLEVIAIRCLFLILLMTPYFIMTARRGEAVLRTSRPGLHFLRMGFQFVSILTGFAALRELPLTTTAAISLVGPIFVAVSAIPILGEKIRPAQIVAIAFGIVGCAIILRPTGEGGTFFILLSLASAAAWSVSMVLLRLLTRTEGASTILLWSNGGVMIAAAALAIPDWRPVETPALLLILCMGATQVVGQWLSLFAFRVARAATVAPVQYTQIIWATIVGAAVFNDWPQPTIWLGAIFIIAGGFWLMRDGRR